MRLSRELFAERCAVPIALGLTSLLIFYWFWAEIRFAPVLYNDGINHIAFIRRMDEVWANGGNIFDFWMAHINFGHAFPRAYQFFMHLLFWLAHKTVFMSFRLERSFNACVTLLAMALPWSFYKGSRIFGLSKLEAVVAALAATFAHESRGYGIGLNNATYAGYGTYNQLLATVLLPMSLGLAHRALRGGRSAILAALFYSLMFMSHILTGYFAMLWIALDAVFAVLRERIQIKTLLTRLAQYSALIILFTGHWLIPMALDGVYQHRSQYENPEKWSGYGASAMLTDYLNGDALDASRLPVVSILAGFGFLLCLIAFFRKKNEVETTRQALAVQTIAWVLLSFGTATWGKALELLPMSRTVHWHRAFALTQVMFCFCAGIAFKALWDWLNPRDKKLKLNFISGAILATTLLYPVLAERQKFFIGTDEYWVKDAVDWWKNKNTGYPGALRFALLHQDARYNAGNPWSWGHKLISTTYIPWYGLLSQFNIETIGAIYHHQSHTELFAFNLKWDDPAQNELANIRYVALPNDMPPPANYKKLLQTNNGALYDNGNVAGYFSIGSKVAGGCADNDALIKLIPIFLKSRLVAAHAYPEINLRRSCEGRQNLETALQSLETSSLPSIPGQVLDSGKQPGPQSDLHWAKVRMERDGIAVFKMNYHPNWRATVDGKPIDTLLVAPMFTAVSLTSGEHRIELWYEPDSLKRLLLWLSGFGSIGALGIAIVRGRRKGSVG